MRQILHYCTFIKYLSIYSSVLPYQSTSRTADETKQRRKKTLCVRSDYLMSLCPSLHSRGQSSLSRVFQASSPLVILSVSYLDSIQARFKRHSAKSSPSLLVQTQSAPSDNLSCCFLSAWSGPVRSIVSPSLPRLHRTETHSHLPTSGFGLYSLTHFLTNHSAVVSGVSDQHLVDAAIRILLIKTV